VIIDWSVIEAAPTHERAVAIVDVLSIVTALLDWRYAAKANRNTAQQKFSAWGAGVAAGLASQAIKSAKAIGEGEAEALRTLLDLLMMSVQLASQLGHDRHQEGSEHYFGYSLENQGAKFSHAEAVGPGILFASALHGQDTSALREALENAGVPLNRLRAADIRLAVNDLPAFCAANNLPYGIAHELDPLSEQVTKALEKAGMVETDTTGWQPPDKMVGEPTPAPEASPSATGFADAPVDTQTPSIDSDSAM
jgi:glycerol dehydrogenase-like iron-containing ADH family enzyme